MTARNDERSDQSGSAAPGPAAILPVIVEHVPGMLAYWDSTLKCRYANRAYERWFGRKPETMIGIHIKDLLGPLYALNLPYIEGALRGEEQRFEREIPDPGGGPPRHAQAHYIPDVVDGVVRGFCVEVADITARKRAEDALRDAERQLMAAEELAALARLATGIAHEINNPLASLLMNLELMLEDNAKGRVTREGLGGCLQEARDAAKRIQEIVQSMKLLAPREARTAEPVDVNDTLEQCMALTANAVRSRARLERDFEDVGRIQGNAQQLAQVFVNLLLNAVQALPETATDRNAIVVRTRREGSAISVEVSDNGSGIPEEVQARIFKPFFTTRDVGQGRGLGLAAARGVVDALGGQISVISNVGQGSTFRVVLPAVAEARGQRAGTGIVEATGVPGSSGRRRVLVVDDDLAVGRTIRRALEPEYEVTVITSAPDAIEALLVPARTGFDVILCDLMMPEVTGDELYHRVCRERPELAQRFVFMTGGAFTPRIRRFLAEVNSDVLYKPFDLGDLRARVLARAAAPPAA